MVGARIGIRMIGIRMTGIKMIGIKIIGMMEDHNLIIVAQDEEEVKET